MNVAVGQLTINSDIYVENDYEGDLAQDVLDQVTSLDWVGWLHHWLNYLSQTTDLPQDCELSIRFTSDRQIQQFNYHYRGLDQATDVLAFATTETEFLMPTAIAEPLYLGDIIISLDTALRQAQAEKHSLPVELAWLSSHGLLHLLGWDHPDDNSLAAMLAQQKELIHSLNVLVTI